MKISYDNEADALYICLVEGDFEENREVMPGVILDVGKKGELLGIEVLDVSARYSLKEIAHMDINLHLETVE